MLIKKQFASSCLLKSHVLCITAPLTTNHHFIFLYERGEDMAASVIDFYKDYCVDQTGVAIIR